ncbi:MAG: DNA-3-methyladenine glycosylase [Planctomycetota bacterium]
MTLDSTQPKLRRCTFAVPADTLAQSLLGCTLVRQLKCGTRLAGVIVETEAYLGAIDKAAHSKGARRTPRTEPMFGPGGTAYVFLIYGMYRCFNIAASTEGDPQAVLIRAVEPTEGIDRMRELRAAKSRARDPNKLPEHLLCSGPARLCDSMDIGLGFSGQDLTSPGEIWIEPRSRRAGGGEPDIGTSVRIGVEYAEEWAEAELRYFVRGSRSISGPKALSCGGRALDYQAGRPGKPTAG